LGVYRERMPSVSTVPPTCLPPQDGTSRSCHGSPPLITRRADLPMRGLETPMIVRLLAEVCEARSSNGDGELPGTLYDQHRALEREDDVGATRRQRHTQLGPLANLALRPDPCSAHVTGRAAHPTG
jgi:hypothetical protein